MMLGLLTLMVASGFAVACLYITLVEQPARLSLPPAALMAQWRVSYHRGTRMQLSIAILAAGLAIASYVQTRDLRWIAGAACLIAIAPYTLLAMMPVNRALLVLQPGNEGSRIVPLVRTWGRRHVGRGALGSAASLIFFWALS